MTLTLEPATTQSPTSTEGSADASLAHLVPEPYLHVGPDRVYSPLLDRHLGEGEPGYADFRAVITGERPLASVPVAVRAELADAGWLVDGRADLDRRFRLKYVSLEAHTVCNQSCYFCPVSVDPREAHFMSSEQYEEILAQLAPYADTLEGVFMINYNEPTADKRFLDQVRAIKRHGLRPATLTNGSGLTFERIDALVEMGGLGFLSINISTLDPERYKATRGTGNVEQIVKYLDYAKDKPVAEEMKIVVLGTGDETHRQDEREIREHFAGSRFQVESYEVMDRAGYLQIGLKVKNRRESLCGCENVGSRPLQHLHITPHAKVVLCCEDYDEHYEVGDLNHESVEEVLTGDKLAQYRRWTYGLEEAPDDFICRSCVFALKRPRAEG